MDRKKLLVVRCALGGIEWYYSVGKSKLRAKYHYEYDEKEKLLEKLYEIITEQPDPSDAKYWRCRECTFANQYYRNYCPHCGTLRG